MKLKDLQAYLENVDGFESPKQELEQYITGPAVAGGLLWAVRGSRVVCALRTAAERRRTMQAICSARCTAALRS